METAFIGDNFLLQNDIARELFHTYAKSLPVIDYHNHLDPAAIAMDKKYKDLGELWVTNDPYKHRAMRINGIPEREISGDAGTKEKYDAWTRTYPNVIGNPLYHWSAIELKRIFSIDGLLNPPTGEAIWQKANELLQKDEFSTIGILRKWNIGIVCTSDDLLSDVGIHRSATERAKTFTVVPSLRADSILAFDTPGFKKWLGRLRETFPIQTLDDYLHAVHLRLDAFDKAGCRLADHALDNGFRFDLPGRDEAFCLFKTYLQTDMLTPGETLRLRSYVLYRLIAEYAVRHWVMQLHIGAERFTSSRLRNLAGAAGGYATIGNTCDIRSLCDFFDHTERAGMLPRTILYTLNPSDNAAFATLTGSFSEDHVFSKIQYGPAWWYNDHKEGMKNHLRTLSNYSLLSRFIGMTTDSRSILSFSRHEYFRRILCNYVGAMAEKGEFPADMNLLSDLVSNISYYNVYEWCFKKKEITPESQVDDHAEKYCYFDFKSLVF